MSYNVYKNCDAKEFSKTKQKLLLLNNRILDDFGSRLQTIERADDSDFLNLNYQIKNSQPFKNNLVIRFDDSMDKSFSIEILKSIDQSGFRFYTKRIIAQKLSLEKTFEAYDELIKSALDNYDQISQDDVLNGERIEI